MPSLKVPKEGLPTIEISMLPTSCFEEMKMLLQLGSIRCKHNTTRPRKNKFKEFLADQAAEASFLRDKSRHKILKLMAKAEEMKAQLEEKLKNALNTS